MSTPIDRINGILAKLGLSGLLDPNQLSDEDVAELENKAKNQILFGKMDFTPELNTAANTENAKIAQMARDLYPTSVSAQKPIVLGQSQDTILNNLQDNGIVKGTNPLTGGVISHTITSPNMAEQLPDGSFINKDTGQPMIPYSDNFYLTKHPSVETITPAFDPMHPYNSVSVNLDPNKFSMENVNNTAKDVVQGAINETNAAEAAGGQGATGLKGLGSKLFGNKNFSGLANAGMGAYQAIAGTKDIMDLVSNQQSTDNFIKDIKDLAYTNPLGMQDLDPRSQRLLRDIQSGAYGNKMMGKQISGGISGVFKNAPKAALSALGGYLAGGGLGAAIQGVGTLARGGIQGANTSQFDSELQGLYNQLEQSNADYRAMRRPANVRAAGLQNRYTRQLY